jgi:FKBP-type peptidyl-prolyl cis-trans isomerase FklB
MMKKIVGLSILLLLFVGLGYGQSKKKRAQNEARMIQGMQFLSDNGKRPEVTTLLSGLQYEVLQEGDGPKPTLTSRVTTHYHGTLIDGSVFDSSVDRGMPATFPVNGVIKGWTEALQLMPVGSKWKLFIPYHLAYGEKGNSSIKPFTTLIFEVELLDIR